jgi:hypothetical protein
MSKNTVAGPNLTRRPWWVRAAKPVGAAALASTLAGCTGSAPASAPAKLGNCAPKILLVTTPDGRRVGDRTVSGENGAIVTILGCGGPLWLLDHSTGDGKRNTIDYNPDAGNPVPVMTGEGVGAFADKPVGNPGFGIVRMLLVQGNQACSSYLANIAPDRRELHSSLGVRAKLPDRFASNICLFQSYQSW